MFDKRYVFAYFVILKLVAIQSYLSYMHTGSQVQFIVYVIAGALALVLLAMFAFGKGEL